MSTLFVNPNSIYNTSQANFILNQDALYTFTKSISAVNDSIWGFQPTRSQLISGITIDDCKDKSLCVVVNNLFSDTETLSGYFDILKNFSTQPFIKYQSINERNAEARNPLAVYLTPLKEIDSDDNDNDNNDCCEWIYVISSTVTSSMWDILNVVESDKDFRLSSIDGKWEQIGTTSFTDSKLSSFFKQIEEISENLATEISNRISVDNEISGNLATEISNRISVDNEISGNLATEISNRISVDNEINNKLNELSRIYISRAEVESVVNSHLSNFEELLSAENFPKTISVMIDWMREIHHCLKDLSYNDQKIEPVSLLSVSFYNALDASDINESNLISTITGENEVTLTLEDFSILSSQVLQNVGLNHAFKGWIDVDSNNEFASEDTPIIFSADARLIPGY